MLQLQQNQIAVNNFQLSKLSLTTDPKIIEIFYLQPIVEIFILPIIILSFAPGDRLNI